ncbi:hypothetical protein [Streptomyces sp. NPDC047972]|uniref:hypothetical protein n=1 Tax=Streptomyces sp. NPDC047972 TaxID=3365493 RepID=UPI003716995F
MATTHVYFDGGTKHGTTLVADTPIDGNIYQPEGFFDREEFYEQTDETRLIGGVRHTVFRYARQKP